MLKLTQGNVEVRILRPAPLCRAGGRADAGEVIRRFPAFKSRLFLRDSALAAFPESNIAGKHPSEDAGSNPADPAIYRVVVQRKNTRLLELLGGLNAIGNAKSRLTAMRGGRLSPPRLF